MFVLDVRTEEEYKEVHIKDAHLIPIKELEQNIDKIPKDKKVVVHCASGKRSAKACEMLKDKGLKELYNLEVELISGRQKAILWKNLNLMLMLSNSKVEILRRFTSQNDTVSHSERKRRI